MKAPVLILCVLALGLAACADDPHPAMHLQPVAKVTIDMDPSRVTPHALVPMAPR